MAVEAMRDHVDRALRTATAFFAWSRRGSHATGCRPGDAWASPRTPTTSASGELSRALARVDDQGRQPGRPARRGAELRRARRCGAHHPQGGRRGGPGLDHGRRTTRRRTRAWAGWRRSSTSARGSRTTCISARSTPQLVGRHSKDEAYYFPPGVDMGPHPETFLGVHPVARRGSRLRHVPALPRGLGQRPDPPARSGFHAGRTRKDSRCRRASCTLRGPH